MEASNRTDLLFCNCFSDNRYRLQAGTGALIFVCRLQNPEKEMYREMRSCAIFPAGRGQEVHASSQSLRKWTGHQITAGSIYLMCTLPI